MPRRRRGLSSGLGPWSALCALARSAIGIRLKSEGQSPNLGPSPSSRERKRRGVAVASHTVAKPMRKLRKELEVENLLHRGPEVTAES